MDTLAEREHSHSILHKLDVLKCTCVGDKLL